jgi:hypothetical protein
MDEMFKSTTVGEGAGYGLGVMISRSKWGRSYGHDGAFPGYLSDLRYYTKYNLAIAVMVNAETPSVDHFLATAVDDFAEVIINATSKSQLSQTERVKIQKFAEDWLNLIYTGRFDESWNQLERFTAALHQRELGRDDALVSTGLGTLTSRKLRANYTVGAAGLVTLDFDVDVRPVTIENRNSSTRLE